MSATETPPREDSRYPHIVRAVREQPWAILPGTFAVILDLIAFRAQGGKLTDEEIQARIGSSGARRDVYMAGSVAVIPVYGVLIPRADMFSEMSGGTSVQRLQAAFRDAMEDDSVSAVLFDIDSPGGQTDMIPEFAAEIRAARGMGKPITAIASTAATSAAYWLGAQADDFSITPSGKVGSIGVFAAHQDISVMQEKLGAKITLVSAGKFKTEGNPFEPLDEDAEKAIQKRVDDAYGMFVSDVAKGRRVPIDSVRSGYGEGRVVTAKAALAEGMVDRIETRDQAVARLTPRRAKAAPVPEPPEPPALTDDTDDEAAASGLSFADEAFAARDAAEALVSRLSSLAEVDRGRLTAAKREALSACPEAFREAAQHVEDVLAATDPDKARKAALSAVAQYEARRAIERGGIAR